jgi:HK97 family phage major capsid protein
VKDKIRRLPPIAGGQDLEEVLKSIDRKLAVTLSPDERKELMAEREQAEKDARGTRRGSRYTEDGGDPHFTRHVANGGDSNDYKGGGDWSGRPISKGPHPLSGIDFLRDVRAARRGDADAFARLRGGGHSKGWTENTGGSGTSGGFLTAPDVLPGYVEARRAASPLRELCANFDVGSDEVWVTVENGTVTVQHVAEAATKPDTTGSVAQKIASNFKVAGTSHVSTELLDDSNGNAGLLVERQFAAQIGIAVDTALISGTGTGQPTGIRNAAGVTATAVDGQTGRLLHDSVLKALSRLEQKLLGPQADQPVSVVVNPRDVVKWSLALDSQNRYMFEGGLAAALPPNVSLIVDANVPTNLGAGTNESVIIVGNFRAGAMFFNRQPLRVDASEHAAWTTNEVVFRGEERYGFAVIQAGAFEILTGITP